MLTSGLLYIYNLLSWNLFWHWKLWCDIDSAFSFSWWLVHKMNKSWSGFLWCSSIFCRVIKSLKFDLGQFYRANLSAFFYNGNIRVVQCLIGNNRFDSNMGSCKSYLLWEKLKRKMKKRIKILNLPPLKCKRYML